MSVRERRLKADYEKMGALFSARSRIRLLKTLGQPPEKYEVEFLVTSLQKDYATQHFRTHNAFIAEITLTGGYPRLAPQCRMLTPVFHPNIAPHAICIGDHWAAGESLPNLVVRIAEMLAFQSYNLRSPLNGEAARWVEQNQAKLPLDQTDFTALLSVGEATGVNPDGTLRAGETCANCGRHAEPGHPALQVCAGGHVACAECILECPSCRRTLCLRCPRETCTVCQRAVCQKCIVKCSTCGQLACLEHAGRCQVCGGHHCANCLVACEVCGRATCVGHIERVEANGRKRYLCPACAAAPASGGPP